MDDISDSLQLLNISEIKKAAEMIKEGKLVAFPTETVYGLGANALNELAVSKIYEVKNRPSVNPLIVHFANLAEIYDFIEVNENFELLSSFWPGPLTIVASLKKDTKIASKVSAGLSSLGVRIPADIIARKLIELSNCPIAAPSANPSNYISPTLPGHVRENFGDADIFILENTKKEHIDSLCGIESTIVDITDENDIKILRHGFITKEEIEKVLKRQISSVLDISAKNFSANIGIKAPGMMSRHYAPHTKITANFAGDAKDCACLNFGSSNLCGVYNLNLSLSSDLTEAAKNFYAMLRMLDNYCKAHSIDIIAIAPIPNHGIGIAINDKISRACCD